MNWLVRGVIIATILAGIAALMMFPEWFSNNEPATSPEHIALEIPAETITDVPENKTSAPSTADPRSDTQNSDKTASGDEPDQTAPLPDYSSLQAPPESLNESDAKVRTLLENLSPQLVAWLTPKEQIRKWVAFVDIVADGKIATQHHPMEYEKPAFMVIREGENLYAAPENHARFDRLISVVTATTPELFANYYRYWQPRLQEAYAELGKGDNFDERAELAMQNILAASPQARPMALRKPTSVTYKFVNEDAERASQITKWMWRIGPKNAAKLQAYIREVQSHLKK